MKKSYLFVLLLLAITLKLSALEITAAAYTGFAGIPLANDTYLGGNNGWNENANQKDTYNNDEMIALFMVTGAGSADKSNIDISVTSPNGLYMVSQSNPTFKRPIMIYAYPVNGFQDRLPPIQLSNEHVSYPVEGITNDNFWLDIVIVLPGILDTNTNRLTVTENNSEVVYPLIEANDYSAIVTITLSVDGKTKSITVPFSGYYDGNLKGVNNATELPVSLGINTYPAAKNIDIAGSMGNWIAVGSISFLLRMGSASPLDSRTDYDSDTDGFLDDDKSYPSSVKNRNCVIMLSSSPNPDDSSANKFVMKKEGLSYNNQLTSFNSVEFEVRAVDNIGGKPITFDGTDNRNKAMSSSGTLLNTKQDWIETTTGFIIPRLRQPLPYFNGASGGANYTVFSKVYDGEIQVRLKSNPVIMSEGRYTGEIYIHVLVEE